MDTVTLIYPGTGSRIVPALELKVPAGAPVAVPVDVAEDLIAAGWLETDEDAFSLEELAAITPRRNRDVAPEADGLEELELELAGDDDDDVEAATVPVTDTTTTDAGDGTTEEQ